MEAATNSSYFPVSATLTLAVGFMTTVTVGSIAWYNFERSIGWEDKERTNFSR
jgi:hypothetical protein